MKEVHPNIEQIVDYLHGELRPAEDAAVHAHLAACSYCEARRAEEAALTDALRAHARAVERDLPLSLVASIRQSVAKANPPTLGERIAAAFRPIVLFPAAAAVAAMLYVGIDVWRSHAAPTTIDAASYVENHAAMAAIAPFADDTPMLTSYNETR